MRWFDAAPRTVVLALAVMLGGLLVGCGEPSRPFAHDETDADNPLLALADPAGIAVEALADFPVAGQKPFLDALIDQLHRAEVPAFVGPGNAQSYRLSGQAVDRRAADGNEVLIHWRLTDADGQLRGNYVVRRQADAAAWNAGDAALMTQLARASTTGIVALLPDRVRANSAPDPRLATGSAAAPNVVPPVGTRASAQRATPRQYAQAGAGPPTPRPNSAAPGTAAGAAAKPAAQPPVALQPVEGAPGDGADALRKAMQYFLNQASIPVVSEYDAPTAIVAGRVIVRDAGAKQQDVQVEWRVYAPSGCQLGTVGQSNRIPAGQLDGKWDNVAYPIAEGAVDGLADLFTKINAKPPEQRCIK